MLMPTRWPPLPFDAWQDTYATLHMWTQIVGKICLALTPLQNHFWNITFRLTPRGLVTPTLFHGERRFTMLFDFVAHELRIQTSDGAIERIALEPRSVAEFYRLVHGVPAHARPRRAHLADAGRSARAGAVRRRHHA